MNRLKVWISERIALLIPTHIDAIRSRFYAKGKEAGHGYGHQEGYRSGHEAGYSAGKEDGYEEGFSQGKSIWVIEDRRAPAKTKSLDQSIYGPSKFGISEQVQKNMRQAVANAVANEVISPPTPEQWKMIFSDSPATCVIAGAGSGKSTTLVLRVVLMLEYLKIPLHEITVVSFTVASCKELRASLVRVLKCWGRTLTEKQAEQLVRTFHSALNRIAKSSFGQVTFFENIGRGKNKPGTVNDEEEEDDVENPFSSARLNNDQITLLNDAYVELFNTNHEFKKHILSMLEIADLDNETSEQDEYKTNILRLASNRDANLVIMTNEKWREKGYWPIEGVTEGPIEAFSAHGFPFYANGRINSTGAFVFLAPSLGNESLFSGDATVSGENAEEEFSIYKANKVKRNIAAQFLAGKRIYLKNPKSVERLRLLDQYSSTKVSPGTAPIFEIKLSGEIKASIVYEAFFSQASFIESMGMEVPATIAQMQSFRAPHLEYYFANALAHYWPYFESRLQSNAVMTFNRAFLLLSGMPPQSKIVDNRILSQFRHLLIDEFQDISPQIVAWLLNCQRQVADREEAEKIVSLMSIGDDWQSIYGWRGSAPDFFINFDDHFPCHSTIGKARVCKMQNNFRSVRPILQDAELLLRPIQNKTEKISKPMFEAGPDDHGIKMIDCGELNRDCLNRIAQFIIEQFEQVKKSGSSQKNKVIVMSRRGDTIDELSPLVGDKPGVVFYTYHRAKGLQGEVAIMIEDCTYDQTHKLRNRVYGCSKVLNKKYNYDMAMRDEAFRLAYVGATRGCKRTYWFLDKTNGASLELINAGLSIEKLPN